MGYILIEGHEEHHAATSVDESLDQIDAMVWFHKMGWTDHPTKAGVMINPTYPGKEGQFVDELPHEFNTRNVIHLLW
jgi:hypothetical protein